MERTPPPEVISNINVFQNIPDLNVISLNELYNKSPVLKNYFQNVFEVLKSYSINSNNHFIIPAILAFPQIALQSQGYLSPKGNIDIKVKFGRKYKKYIINIDGNQKKEEKKTRKINDNIAKVISYDISNLPVLAELLASAAVFNSDTVNQRLEWLESNELNIKIEKPKYQQTTIEGQITHLISDFAVYWENDQTVGWQKLIRNFILGFEMHSFYKNKLSKVPKKGKRKADDEKPKVPNFVKDNAKIYSQCIKELINNKETQNVIDSTVSRMNAQYSGTEDYNYIKSHEDLLCKIKKNMKFSYMLYYFVLMFGYIALISPPTTDQSELNKYFKLSDYEEIIEKFDFMKKSQLGKDLIKANNYYGTKILETVLKCADDLKINNSNLTNGLTMIKTQYLFIKNNDRSNSIRGISTKKQRLAFSSASDVITNDSESVISASVNSESSFNGKKRKIDWRKEMNNERRRYERVLKDQKEQYDNSLLNLGEQINHLSKKVSNKDKDELNKVRSKNSRVSKRKITKKNLPRKSIVEELSASEEIDELKDDYDNTIIDDDVKYFPGVEAAQNSYNIEFTDYDFDLQMKEIDPKSKEDMISKFSIAYNGLSESSKVAVNNLASNLFESMGNTNYPTDDKTLICRYNSIKMFIEQNNYKVISENERKNYQNAIDEFKSDLSDHKQRIYDEEVNNSMKKISKVDKLRSDADINLLCEHEAIEICRNDRFDEFYEEGDSAMDTNDE